MKHHESNFRSFVRLGIAAALFISAGCDNSAPPPPSSQPQAQAPAQTPVKYPTLPPSNFTGRAREAYQAALDVPEVLKEVQCYCGCAASDGHKNNLYCFMDLHGAG